jgi:hypothetical protein
LDPVVVEPSSGNDSEAVKMCYVVRGKECGKDVTDQTANGVDSEDVKRIINAKDELEFCGIVCAYRN